MLNLLKSLTAIALLLSFSTPSLFADEDDLFSKVRAKSVFEDSSGGDADQNSASKGKRITKTEDLRDLLKSAGFEAKVASSRAVTTDKQLDPWTFPVLLVISEDESQISINLGLATVKDVASELPADKLLQMMTASQDNAPMLFSYHAKRQRTEVSQVLKNKQLTGLMLRDEINRMAILAKNNSDLWSTAGSKTTPPETQKKTATTPSTTPVTAATLAGKWSAARSDKEAFAVELTAKGKFNLVYIKDGKQTKSSGTFTVSAGQLSLVGSDGLKLEGRLTVNSSTEFRFEPGKSKALVFKKAK